jgi:hypothetical protein
MNAPPILSVRTACGRADLLGIASGKAALPKLAAAADALSPEHCVLLDFAEIEMVTASAARESVLRLIAHLADRKCLAVLVNMNAETRDDIEFAAQAGRQIIVTATSVGEHGPADLKLYGPVDDKIKETLALVSKLGETDAKGANDAHIGSTIGATAWNNRLATLAQIRLLKERKVGKTKYYSLALKGLVDGN